MLRRVDAENRLQTLKEELDFQKNIYSEVGTAGRAGDTRPPAPDVDRGVRAQLPDSLREGGGARGDQRPSPRLKCCRQRLPGLGPAGSPAAGSPPLRTELSLGLCDASRSCVRPSAATRRGWWRSTTASSGSSRAGWLTPCRSCGPSTRTRWSSTRRSWRRPTPPRCGLPAAGRWGAGGARAGARRAPASSRALQP